MTAVIDVKASGAFPAMLCCAFLGAAAAAPALVPVPALAGEARGSWRVEREITAAAAELKASREKQKRIQEQARALEKELKPLQEEMVALAEHIRRTEMALAPLEEKLKAMELEKARKRAALARRRGGLAASVEAMLRLSRTPPQAVIAMPGELRSTLRAARTLGVLTGALQREARILAEELESLESLERDIAASHRDLSALMADLEDRQRAMDKQYEKRRELQEKLHADGKNAGRAVAELSRRSASLKELVQTLESRRAAARRGGEEAPSPPRAENGRSFAASKGKIRLPVAGKISSFFGGAREGKEKHPGITIAARPFAQVIAPFDGEVVFTGPFLDYGPMVIIRHAPAYHILLAGMERIDCAPGQSLMSGEPLGAMGAEGKSSLYVELRKNSRPVDPGQWFERSGG